MTPICECKSSSEGHGGTQQQWMPNKAQALEVVDHVMKPAWATFTALQFLRLTQML